MGLLVVLLITKPSMEAVADCRRRNTEAAITLTLMIYLAYCHTPFPTFVTSPARIALAPGRIMMKAMQWKSVLVLAVVLTAPTLAQNKDANGKRRDDLKKPLVIASQGSFFVGGESKTLPPTPGPAITAGGGEVTVNQM